MPKPENASTSLTQEDFSSWKEIAAYLGVSIRRAQQWETELGLPVDRINTEQRARIRAKRSEIDRWLNKRTGERQSAQPCNDAASEPESQPLPSPVSPSALPAQARPRPGSVGWVVGLAASALLLAAATWFAWPAIRPKPSDPASAAIVDGRLRVSDSQGRLLWQVAFPEGDAGIPTPVVAPARVGGFWISNTDIIDDLDGDAATEVLFVLNRHGSSGVPVGDRVFCFAEDGRERWRFTPGRPLSWGGRIFDNEYFVAWVAGPFAVAHRPVLAVGAQNTFFPFQISLLDATTGRLLGEYWHLGGLGAVLIVDGNGDGAYEILAGGVNNPGPGPGLPALVRLRPSSLRPIAPGADVFQHSPSSEADYLLFPSLNGLERDDVPRRIAWMTIGDRRTVQLAVSFGPRFQDRGQVYYTLDADLHVLDARPCDLLRAYHRRLVDEGRLAGSLSETDIAAWRDVKQFSSMPNANLPGIRALWPVARPPARR